MIRYYFRYHFRLVMVLLVPVVFAILLLHGCDGKHTPEPTDDTPWRAEAKTIWTSESKSADGRWIATARTQSVAGRNITAQWTDVQLKQALHENAQPVTILTFDENSTNVHDLKMSWIASSHLEVSYKGNAPLTFQAIKAFGKDISVSQLPD